MKKILIFAILWTAAASAGFSANVAASWSGSFTGTQAWDLPTNWTPNTAYPNNGANNFGATIANTTSGSLLIETPGTTKITLSRFRIEQSGTGSTTLKLGNDFEVTTGSGTPISSFENSTSAPANLVLDLNGYTFSAASTDPTNNLLPKAKNYTLRDTSAGGNGTFVLPGITYDATRAGRVNVEDNVTVKIVENKTVDMRGAGTSATEGWNFSATSTLWVAKDGYAGASFVGGTLGNVIVGSVSNSTYTKLYFASSAINVFGDITYNQALDGTGSYIALGTSAKVSLAGNFTDKNTDNLDYAFSANTATSILFNGGIANEREVWIARNGLTTSFLVGVDAATRGNIVLKHDLITAMNTNANSGKFSLLKGSRVNLDIFAVTASSVLIQSGTSADTMPTLAFTFGAGSNALLHATGTTSTSFTLGSFDLELNYNGLGWNDGDNLRLFRYDATSFSGTPLLASLTAPANFTYDSLAWGSLGDGNYVYLKNVSMIPEPGSGVLLGFGFLLMIAASRRISQCNPERCSRSSSDALHSSKR